MGELIEYKPKVESVGAQRLETSALGLTFSVKPKYVMVGLKLECTASIGSVYWQSFQETPKVSQKEQPAISGNWGIFSSAAGTFSNVLSIKSIFFVFFLSSLSFILLAIFVTLSVFLVMASLLLVDEFRSMFFYN